MHHHAGAQWNTRVVVIPDAPRVTRRPLPVLLAPELCSRGGRGIALPLVHSAWITGLVFAVLNAALLRTRIGIENSALASLK